MRKVLAVIRREYVARVRTKGFVIGTIALPLIMVGFTILPIMLARRDVGAKRVAVVDASTNGLGRELAEALSAARRGKGPDGKLRYQVVRVDAAGRLDAVRDSLIRRVGIGADSAGALDGLLIVSDDALSGGKLAYLGENVGSPDDMGALERTASAVVQHARLAQAGLDERVVGQVLAPVNLKTLKVTKGQLTGESGEASFFLAYIMSFLLYLVLLLYGAQVTTSVIEEKTNRIFEVLTSSLSPFELLLGKVVGVGAVGLTQMGIWAGTAALVTNNVDRIATLLGAPEAAAGLSLPTVSPALLGIYLLFFVLGFMFYAAAYAAVGASCNQVQEAQQAATPLTLCVAAGLFLMFALLNDPNGTLGRVLSLVPPFAPFITPVRYSVSPLGAGEIAVSLAAMLVGVAAMVWVASRIYRVGILSYGKKASIVEMMRWVRTA